MRSKRLKPIVNFSESVEKDAAKELGAAQELLNNAVEKLNELLVYKNDYIREFKKSSNSGSSAARMQDFRVFLNKIEIALNQQREKINVAKEQFLKKKKNWMGKHKRRKVLDKVVERYDRKQRKEDQQREQRESDEISSRSANLVDDIND